MITRTFGWVNREAAWWVWMSGWNDRAIPPSYRLRYTGKWVALVVRPGFELGTSCTGGSECTTTPLREGEESVRSCSYTSPRRALEPGQLIYNRLKNCALGMLAASPTQFVTCCIHGSRDLLRHSSSCNSFGRRSPHYCRAYFKV